MSDADRPGVQRPPSARDRHPEDGRNPWRQLRHATTAESFARAWLDIQCRLIRGAAGGAVFAVQSAGGTITLSPVALVGDAAADPQALLDVARQAVSSHRQVVARHPLADVERPRYLVAYAVYVSDAAALAVTVDVAARPRAELTPVFRQLEWGAGWLEALVYRRMLAAPREAPPAQGVLEVVAGALHQGRFHAAATALATALAARLDCDRVSVGVVRRGRAHVRAVSHTADLGQRTNAVRAIGAVMDEAIDQKGPVVHPALPGTPASVMRAHEEAGGQARASILSVPLARGTRLVGALTLERPLARPFDPETLAFAQAVAAVAGPALEALRREDRPLAARAVDAARTGLGSIVGAGHLGLKLGVTAAVVALAAVCLIKGEYRVAARAVMEANVRRVAAAPFAGYVREAPARAGDLVRRGDLLAAMDDRELRLERAKWSGQQEQLVKVQHQALAARNAGQIAIATAQIDQARAQLALIDEQLARSRVVAPFDGVVVVGDLSQALGSPVEKGQVLFQVAPLDAYRVVLEVDERDIADVAVGQRGRLLLAAAPDAPLAFTVRQITPVSTAREGRNHFRVEATLDRPPERLRPGMEGVGKVIIGDARIVTIWTRSLVDWARVALWTWTP